MSYEPRTKTHPAIAAIVQAEAEVERARQALQDAVDAARAEGHSWATIGEALDVSKQAAQQRFGLG